MEGRFPNQFPAEEEEEKKKKEDKMEADDTPKEKVSHKRKLSISASTSDLPNVASSHDTFFTSDSAINLPNLKNKMTVEVSVGKDEIDEFLSLPMHLDMTKNINLGQQLSFIHGYFDNNFYHSNIYKNENNQYLNDKGGTFDNKNLFFVITKDKINQKLNLKIGYRVQGHYYLALDLEQVADRIQQEQVKTGLVDKKLQELICSNKDFLQGIEHYEVVAAGEVHFKDGKLHRITAKAGCFYIEPKSVDFDKYIASIKNAIGKFEIFKDVQMILDFKQIKQLDEKRAAKKLKTAEPASDAEQASQKKLT